MNYIDMYNDALQHGEIIACKRVKNFYPPCGGDRKAGYVGV